MNLLTETECRFEMASSIIGSIESEAYLNVNPMLFRVIDENPTDMANEFVAVKLISTKTWKEVLVGKDSAAEKARKLHAEVATSLSKDGSLLDKLTAILTKKNFEAIVTELNKNLNQLSEYNNSSVQCFTQFF